MTLEDDVWTLFREGPDWPQRYVGELSEDGNTITGRWERAPSWVPPWSTTSTCRTRACADSGWGRHHAGNAMTTRIQAPTTRIGTV
jgi:hypothetical protein